MWGIEGLKVAVWIRNLPDLIMFLFKSSFSDWLLGFQDFWLENLLGPYLKTKILEIIMEKHNLSEAPVFSSTKS